MRVAGSPVRVAVVADDLTGAADCGAQFARSGYRTAVIFEGAPLPDRDDLDALALDTDSRELAAPAARRRVAAATKSVRSAPVLYKKLDSTLRGNVAAELGAALEASGRVSGMLAPAFPQMGRTTRGGGQMIHGEPLSSTGFAGAAGSGGHVPALLREGGLGPVVVLGADDLKDQEKVRAALKRACWVVADAECEEHLETLARSVADPSVVLWAGSAGLAHALGKVYPGSRSRTPRTFFASRVLTVVGSTSEVVREQLGILTDDPRVGLVVLGTPEDTLAAARDTLGRGRSVAVCSGVQREKGAERKTAAALARVAAALEREGLLDALVLSGGETAARVASALGARGILLEGEVEPGVPVGTLLGPRPYPVVTKAGGFGSAGTLKQALHTLTGEEK